MITPLFERTLLLTPQSHQAGRLLDAERLCHVIKESHPIQSEVVHGLSDHAMTVGNAREALPIYVAALTSNNTAIYSWSEFINALILTHQVDLVRNVLEQAKPFWVSAQINPELA